MESVAATSLTVKWDAPAGERTSYIVTLDDGSGNEETKTPDHDVTSAKFTGLTAGKSYTVRLVTVSGSPKFNTSKSNRCFYEVQTNPLLDKNPYFQIHLHIYIYICAHNLVPIGPVVWLSFLDF